MIALRRRPDWRPRLHAYVEAQRRTPHVWGASDCALYVAGGLRAMTDVDLAADWRGTYESPTGALLALRRAGFADLPALASSFLAEIAPLAATAGDVVGLEVEGGWSLGLSIGARASMRGTDQILTIDRLQAQRAWRTP